MKRYTQPAYQSLITIAMSLTIAFSACSPDPEELYNRGATFAQQKQFDQALKSFDELKEVAGDSSLYQYKSLYGRAEVLRLKEDLNAQADLLGVILDQQAYSDYHPLVKEKLEENLLAKAAKERLKPDPSGAVSLYQKAIELNPKSEARTLMVSFLTAKADASLNDHKIDDAIKGYQEALELITSDETLTKQLTSKINIARFSQYKLKAQQLFAAQIKELTEQKIYDAQTKTFYFKLTVNVDGKVDRKNKDEQLKAAKDLASKASLSHVNERLKALFELENMPQVDPAQITVTKSEFHRSAKRLKIDKKRVLVTPFDYHFTLPLEAAYELAFEASNRSE